MLKAQRANKAISIAVALLITWMLSPFALFGGLQTAYAGTVSQMSATSDSANITLTYSGTTDNQWYNQDGLQLVYADGETHTIYVNSAISSNSISANVDGWLPITDNCSLSASSTSAYTATLVIPASYFGGRSFTISANGQSVSSDSLASSPSDGGSGSGSNGGGQPGSGGQGSDGGSSSQGGSEGIDTPALTPTTRGAIVVDGANGDWANIESRPSNDSKIAEWKIARDASGNVYLMLDGTAVSQWDYNFQYASFSVSQNGGSTGYQFSTVANYISGADVQMTNSANGNSAGPYVLECLIPASYFIDANATVSFLGITVNLDDIPVVDGNAVDEGGDDVYDGIVIDGSFKDWNAVTKHDAWCDNGAHLNCIDQTAVVWDGDTLYVYIHESPGGSATGAGTHGNGLYAFTTDLGHQMLFQLNANDTVSGVEGATASHVGAQWEIAIPASNLPEYLKSLSFGMYTASDPADDEVFITDITNLNGSGSGGEFGGDIVIDGNYGDWAYYPHQIIEYATQGTQSLVEDSEGALYSKDGMLYAHVYTTMPAHIDNGNGGEFLAAVSVAFNGDRGFKGLPEDGNFYPKFFVVDGTGNITVVNEGTHLPDGTYTFYISDIRSTFDLRNTKFDDVPDSEIFGKMMVTVSEGKDEMEFEIDLRKVAAYIGADADDLKIIESQFGRLGQQWISTAGTSTLPFVGIGLGIGVVACVLGSRKLRAGAQASEAAAGLSDGAND